jgi:hypothetical protein
VYAPSTLVSGCASSGSGSNAGRDDDDRTSGAAVARPTVSFHGRAARPRQNCAFITSDDGGRLDGRHA